MDLSPGTARPRRPPRRQKADDHRGQRRTWGQEIPKTLGYVAEADGEMFGWGGTGGSLAGAAPRHGLALAATKNALAFGDDDPMEELRMLILDSVAGAPTGHPY